MKINNINIGVKLNYLLYIFFICGIFQLSSQTSRNHNLKEIYRDDIWVIFPDDFCGINNGENGFPATSLLPGIYESPLVLFHSYESINIGYTDIVKNIGDKDILKRKWIIQMKNGINISNLIHYQYFYNIEYDALKFEKETWSKIVNTSISPNPFSKELVIKLNIKETSLITVTIRDINDRIVFYNIYDIQLENIIINSFEGFKPGVYFASISTKNWLETHKIVFIN